MKLSIVKLDLLPAFFMALNIAADNDLSDSNL